MNKPICNSVRLGLFLMLKLRLMLLLGSIFFMYMYVYGIKLERKAWGGTTIRVPQYNLEVSRAGFNYCGANLFNSLTLSIREEKKTLVFKASVKKWVKENIGISPNRCFLL